MFCCQFLALIVEFSLTDFDKEITTNKAQPKPDVVRKMEGFIKPKRVGGYPIFAFLPPTALPVNDSPNVFKPKLSQSEGLASYLNESPQNDSAKSSEDEDGNSSMASYGFGDEIENQL